MESVYQAIAAEPDEVEQQERGLPPLPRHFDGHRQLSARELAEWRWANVDNLDLFLEEMYEYYQQRGFYCILLQRCLQLLTVLFVVWFSTYLYSCIDYSLLRNASTLQEARVSHCLAKTTWIHYLFLWIFGILWTLKLFQYISGTRALWEMHEFYHHLLKLSEGELQTVSWQQVVERLEKLRSLNGATQKRLDAHEIVNRIMRRENYFIALYNRNVLDLQVELPFFGHTEFLTKILEWSIALCLDDYVFNTRGYVRSLVLREDRRDLLAQGLRRRFQLAALLSVVLAPLALFYTTVYYFFKYFNEFYSSPKSLGARQYTPLAEWHFRELNELYHLFKRRISMSDAPAQRYISQFPRWKTELMLKFLIFMLSAFAAVLVALSIYDPDLLNLEIRPGQNVVLYLTSLGLAIAVCRAMLATPQEQAIYQPETSMRQIVEFTHYMPDSWIGRLHTEKVKAEFCTLYDLKPKIMLREMLSVVLNPVILGLKLADRSERIIDFFREFSTNVDSLGGHVCSLAVFNTDRINKVKARSDELDKFYATQDGKMLKSYLNFMDVYGNPQLGGSYAYQSHYDPFKEQSRIVLGVSEPPTQTAIQPPSAESKPVNAMGSSPNHSSNGFSQTDSIMPARRPPSSGMDASVMHQYERLRQLAPVREEPPSSDSLYTHDEEEDSIARDGVMGLLNNLYRR